MISRPICWILEHRPNNYISRTWISNVLTHECSCQPRQNFFMNEIRNVNENYTHEPKESQQDTI